MSGKPDRRPNVLWLMSDQHNASCVGYANHPNVRTPNIDRIAHDGVEFTNMFANSPICSPSRNSFITGQYVHTHRLFGNYYANYSVPNPETVACQFRRYGYQTGLFGKSHMVGRWDADGFEVIRYTSPWSDVDDDPMTCHYFKYLDEHGLADSYESGYLRDGHEYETDGSSPSMLPYEHSVEHYIRRETVDFFTNRDPARPFFIQVSFDRPHSPVTPSKEHFDMYNPEDIALPANAIDYFENCFAGKPKFMQDMLKNGCEYPLADANPERLKRCLASYYALITVIDSEIGHILRKLQEIDELDNTIIVYTSDHGDFAGEHGLFHKGLGIYDCIHRIPFLISWPDGPKGTKCDEIAEAVDVYPTLCELCRVPLPTDRDGLSLLPIVCDQAPGKDAAYCEHVGGGEFSAAVRTKNHRLVYYSGNKTGELYDHQNDPGEIHNLWDNQDYVGKRMELTEKLFSFTLDYSKTFCDLNKYSPIRLMLLSGGEFWSNLKRTYKEGPS